MGRRCMRRGSSGSLGRAGRRRRMSGCSFRSRTFRRRFFPLCLVSAFGGWRGLFGGWRSLRELDRRGLRVQRRRRQRRDSESRRGQQHQAKVRHDNYYPNKKFGDKREVCWPMVAGARSTDSDKAVMWQRSAAKTDFIFGRTNEMRTAFIAHSDRASFAGDALLVSYVSTSVAGGCAGGVGGLGVGNSSGIWPGNSCGGAGDSGSCIGGGTSGPGCG